MATLLEHVYAIHNIKANGPVSDDHPYSDTLVAHFLKLGRSLLLKRKLDKYHPISELSYQIICIELQESDYNNCNCDFIDLPDCKILRSKCRIPKDIVLRWGTSIQAKFLDGRIISASNPTRNSYSQYSITNANKHIGWFIEDGYVYLINDKVIPFILLKAVWEDPEQVLNFCAACVSQDNYPCDNNTDFPIDAELVQPMYELTLQLLEHASTQPRDNENNSKSVEKVQGSE